MESSLHATEGAAASPALVARSRRRSVAELERILDIAESMEALGPAGGLSLARRFGLSCLEARRAAGLLRAERAGALATASPMTLYEAEVAAGIRGMDGEYGPAWKCLGPHLVPS